jgi:membrane carboxypeptidase/penicillin-binding protein
MITLTNIISGHLLWVVSLLVLTFSPSIKLQYLTVKETVANSLSDIKNIPDHLIYSLLLIEDRRFLKHKGVDVYAIIRALAINVSTKRIEGASTIVQQLVRNITNERDIKVKRKIKEILFASLLDKEFSKDKILIAYFNTYQFKNCSGILAFCHIENYNLDNITKKQSAEIAARFKYPTITKDNYIKYLKRVRTIERKTAANIGFASGGLTCFY